MVVGLAGGVMAALLFGSHVARRIEQLTDSARRLAGRQPLAPGVYKTEPYTCIVVVPRAHADDRMVIGMLDKTESKMPMIEPKLKFVP